MAKRSVLAAACAIVCVGVFPAVVCGQVGEYRTISSDTAAIATPAQQGGDATRPRTELDELSCFVIDFEGFGNNSPIGIIGGDVTITFGTSWLGLIDSDAGGSGNFANEPSPSTTAYFLDTSDISIMVEPAAQLVEFYYSAAAISLPVTVTAYDAGGNLVDEATGDLVGTHYDGAPCSGDPNGEYCRWGIISLSSTLNNIHSIVIEGTVANYFGIDNLRLCAGECAVPGAAAPEVSAIPIPAGCGILSGGCMEERDIGGDSQPDCLLSRMTSDLGEELELWCVRDGFLGSHSWYGLYYTGPEGAARPNRVAICPWPGGRNTGRVFHSGNRDGTGGIDCFIRTWWRSIDGGVDEDGDGKIDWWEYTFDIISRNLSKTHYESTDGPGGTAPDVPVSSDPPLGPLTEAFFDSLVAILETFPGGDPMLPDLSLRCDLDRDGVCGPGDIEIFDASFEKCRGDDTFNSLADADGDGCVTLVDREILFPSVIAATVDLEPKTVNLKSKGKYVTCYIELPEGHDPVDIFVPSILLNEVIPAQLNPSAVEDHDYDGIPDRMVKFSRIALIDLLAGAGGRVEVTVTGTLVDGTPFEGGDDITVINPGRNADQADVLEVSPALVTDAATITYELAVEGDVSLRIFDAAGRLVRTLETGNRAAGAHTITWDRRADDGHEVGSGVYFIRLKQGGNDVVKKLLILK